MIASAGALEELLTDIFSTYEHLSSPFDAVNKRPISPLEPPPESSEAKGESNYSCPLPEWLDGIDKEEEDEDGEYVPQPKGSTPNTIASFPLPSFNVTSSWSKPTPLPPPPPPPEDPPSPPKKKIKSEIRVPATTRKPEAPVVSNGESDDDEYQPHQPRSAHYKNKSNTNTNNSIKPVQSKPFTKAKPPPKTAVAVVVAAQKKKSDKSSTSTDDSTASYKPKSKIRRRSQSGSSGDNRRPSPLPQLPIFDSRYYLPRTPEEEKEYQQKLQWQAERQAREALLEQQIKERQKREDEERLRRLREKKEREERERRELEEQLQRERDRKEREKREREERLLREQQKKLEEEQKVKNRLEEWRNQILNRAKNIQRGIQQITETKSEASTSEYVPKATSPVVSTASTERFNPVLPITCTFSPPPLLPSLQSKNSSVISDKPDDVAHDTIQVDEITISSKQPPQEICIASTVSTITSNQNNPQPQSTITIQSNIMDTNDNPEVVIADNKNAQEEPKNTNQEQPHTPKKTKKSKSKIISTTTTTSSKSINIKKPENPEHLERVREWISSLPENNQIEAVPIPNTKDTPPVMKKRARSPTVTPPSSDSDRGANSEEEYSPTMKPITNATVPPVISLQSTVTLPKRS